jgi:hypothetical protein
MDHEHVEQGRSRKDQMQQRQQVQEHSDDEAAEVWRMDQNVQQQVVQMDHEQPDDEQELELEQQRKGRMHDDHQWEERHCHSQQEQVKRKDQTLQHCVQRRLAYWQLARQMDHAQVEQIQEQVQEQRMDRMHYYAQEQQLKLAQV